MRRALIVLVSLAAWPMAASAQPGQARELTLTVGAHVVVLTEQRTEGPIGAVCRAAGVNFRRADEGATAKA